MKNQKSLINNKANNKIDKKADFKQLGLQQKEINSQG